MGEGRIYKGKKGQEWEGKEEGKERKGRKGMELETQGREMGKEKIKHKDREWKRIGGNRRKRNGVERE